MILPSDIIDVIKKYSTNLEYNTYERDYSYDGYKSVKKSLGNGVKEDRYSALANDIYAQVVGPYLENAELKAKVFAYEAIISNSNFKAAIVKKGEKK